MVYVGGMDQTSLARTLTAVMVAGDVMGVDLRDAGNAHRALRYLWGSPDGQAACQHLAVSVTTVPDPDVGLRVRGLTQALWLAASMRYLKPVDDTSFLAVSDTARDMTESMLRGLSENERAAVAAAGQAWAFRSTVRKTLASSLAFPPGT